MTTILIIVVRFLLFGGGGFYGFRRRLITQSESIDLVDKGCGPNAGVLGFPEVAEPVQLAASLRDDQREPESREGIAPNLAGVSETMLWSLYNRASEAGRPDGVLIDPESMRIQSAINYDFALFRRSPGFTRGTRGRNRPRVTVVA